MALPLRVLVVEDDPNDVALLLHQLRNQGFAPEPCHVDNEQDYLRHLRDGFDLIVSDHELPRFSGLRALELLNDSGLGIPFILISGAIGEEVAVEAMKLGAADYLLKDRPARLGLAVKQALEQARLRRERRQAEASLRLFRTLVDQSEDTFEVINPTTGRFVDVSAKGCAECGYTREEYLALRVSDIDPALTETNWNQLIERLREEGSFRRESVHRRKDGSLFPVELRATWVRLDRYYIVATVRDITARREAERSLRESEERFRQFAENIHEVFWMTDPAKQTTLYVSPAYEAIWGRTCASLYTAPESWLDAVHPEDRERVREATTRQVAGGYDEVYRIQRPDGSVRWIRDRAFPIRDADGAVYRLACTAEDITERRRLEEQFRQSQKMEAIGTLAGGIAHDFNNILGAIIGYTELAAMRVEGPPVAGYLKAVLQGAARASELVRQILAFSRQQEQRRRPVDLRLVVSEPLKLLRATLPATIEFDIALARGLPPVLADPTQIHQVVMNLCTNAGHAMRDRPGRLSVRLVAFEVDAHVARTHPDLHPGSLLRLTVSDTGTGMDRATQERIFEPFFTTKKQGEGTGLGLSVVLGIMQSHEGAITLYSQPGEGTTFHLYFPVQEAGPVETESGKAAAPRGRGQRILLVDDEPALAELGKAMLHQLGYAAESSTDVRAALAQLSADPSAFDLVITDLAMPGMTGVDFARELLRLRPGLPIILTTGYSATLTDQKVRELGIRELLLKPPTLLTLGEVLHRVLDGE